MRRPRRLSRRQAGILQVNLSEQRPMHLHRRHLTPSQASMVAARAKGIYEEQAKER